MSHFKNQREKTQVCLKGWAKGKEIPPGTQKAPEPQENNATQGASPVISLSVVDTDALKPGVLPYLVWGLFVLSLSSSLHCPTNVLCDIGK